LSHFPHVFFLITPRIMDQRTSPTRRSCRQYWNNLPAHRKREILSHDEWTTFTSLINLPPTRRRGGCHHLSDNKGDDEADDADVGEDSVSDDADDANNADKTIRSLPNHQVITTMTTTTTATKTTTKTRTMTTITTATTKEILLSTIVIIF